MTQLNIANKRHVNNKKLDKCGTSRSMTNIQYVPMVADQSMKYLLPAFCLAFLGSCYRASIPANASKNHGSPWLSP